MRSARARIGRTRAGASERGAPSIVVSRFAEVSPSALPAILFKPTTMIAAGRQLPVFLAQLAR
jgi:hypothetical protein